VKPDLFLGLCAMEVGVEDVHVEDGIEPRRAKKLMGGRTCWGGGGQNEWGGGGRFTIIGGGGGNGMGGGCDVTMILLRFDRADNSSSRVSLSMEPSLNRLRLRSKLPFSNIEIAFGCKVQ
jgi:hypothetical protein